MPTDKKYILDINVRRRIAARTWTPPVWFFVCRETESGGDLIDAYESVALAIRKAKDLKCVVRVGVIAQGDVRIV